MLFSVNWKSDKKKLADEIKCPYNKLGYLYNFMKENPDKRYLIEVDDMYDYDKLVEQVQIVRETANDYTVSTKHITLVKRLINDGYNAFLCFPITDWEAFRNLQSLGASDIYIDGPIAFQGSRLTNGKGNTKIRVSPNFSSSTALTQLVATSFYIRPEDLYLYENIIDIIDFKTNIQDREDALFSIYKRGTFNYELDQLIPGLPRIGNLLLDKDFGEIRLNCGQKCNIPGHRCSYCDVTFSILENSLKLMELQEKMRLDNTK